MFRILSLFSMYYLNLTLYSSDTYHQFSQIAAISNQFMFLRYIYMTLYHENIIETKYDQITAYEISWYG